MSKIFSKPKKPKRDTEQDELVRQQKERMKEQEAEIAYKRAMAKRKGHGRRSLISGAETGITGTPTRETTG